MIRKMHFRLCVAMGDNFYHFGRRFGVFVGYTRSIRGIFTGYSYVSGMCRECIGYVSGIYRKIRGGKMRKNYVHNTECCSGVRVYVVLCQSPAFALKYPVYFLKIVAKILRKVIFCQNETLICEYRTSFS